MINSIQKFILYYTPSTLINENVTKLFQKYCPDFQSLKNPLQLSERGNIAILTGGIKEFAASTKSYIHKAMITLSILAIFPALVAVIIIGFALSNGILYLTGTRLIKLIQVYFDKLDNAIQENDYEEIRKLVKPLYFIPIHLNRTVQKLGCWAAEKGHVDILTSIYNKTSTDSILWNRNRFAKTAIEHNQTEVLRFLVNHPSFPIIATDLHHFDVDGFEHTPSINNAASAGHSDAFEILMNHFDISMIYPILTSSAPQHAQNHLKIVQSLYRHSPDYEQNGVTHLDLAARSRNPEAVAWILKQEVEFQDSTLFLAVSDDNPSVKIIESLLKHENCNPNVTDRDGNTPLNLYLEKPNTEDFQIRPEIIEVFFKNNPNLALPNASGKTPLDQIASREPWILDLLIKYDLITYEEMQTIFIQAIQNGREEIAKRLLVEEGVDPNHLEETILNPLRGEKVALYLLEHKDFLFSDRDTPLHISARNAWYNNIVHFYNIFPENVDLENDRGETPLYLAATQRRENSYAIANFLISKGASLQNALDFAGESDHDDKGEQVTFLHQFKSTMGKSANG
ncbi:MAG: hypothetical protein ChlgKO_11970 [Chlamydiales bacterium]